MNGQTLSRKRRIQRLKEHASDGTRDVVWPLLDSLQQNPKSVRFKHRLQIKNGYGAQKGENRKVPNLSL